MAAPEFRRARRFVNQSRFRIAVNHACGAVAGLLYVGWMALLVLCMDLFIHRGTAMFDEEEAAFAARLHAAALPSEAAGLRTTGTIHDRTCKDAGLLPTVVRLREKWYAPALVWTYQNVPSCRENFGLLIAVFAAAVVIGAVRLGLLGIQNRVLVAASTYAQASLQEAVFRKQFELGGAAVDSATRERIEPILKTDVPTMIAGVQTYMDRIGRETAKIAALLAFALSINLPLGMTFVILSAIAWVLGSQIVERHRARGRRLVSTAESATNRLVGLAGKHRLIWAYNADEYYSRQFRGFVQRAARATRERLTYEGRLAPLWQFVGLMIFIIVFALAAQNVLADKFQLSAAAGFFAALLSIPLPVANLIAMRTAIRNGGAAAQRVFGFLDLPTPPKQKQTTTVLPTLKESIEFERVSYAEFEGPQILSDVSIRIHKGQKIAVIGKDEAEARAFIYLLTRFVEPTEGRVKLDGQDIRRGAIESLRRQIGVVLQDELLFPDTIANNIGCGDPRYSLTQITEAAKVAHAHQFIQRLPHGYECVVGDEGFPLKRGEAYRIALARAILRDPPIACIEEPRDTLDADTKALLDDTMERFCIGRTVLVLPTRISTIRSCDQVFLFADGKLAAVGTHKELSQTSELYRHLQYVEFTTPQFAT